MARGDPELLWGIDRRGSAVVAAAALAALPASYLWIGQLGATPSVRLWMAVLLAALGAFVAGFLNRGIAVGGLLPLAPAVAFALSGIGRPYVDDPDFSVPAVLIAFGLGLAAAAVGAGVRTRVWEPDADADADGDSGTEPGG